jgi:hypothetical protein
MPRPSPNTGLRLPPFTKAVLRSILEALEGIGESPKQDDLVAVLLDRASAECTNGKELAKLATEMRAQRAKARAIGF